MKISTIRLMTFGIFLSLTAVIIDLNQEIKLKDQELLEVKKTIIQLDEDLTSKEEMILSLNEDLDTYYLYDKIVKDLRWSK